MLLDLTPHHLNSPDCCGICEEAKYSLLEEHHIIPQAYGGRDGALIMLCGNCHTDVHTIHADPSLCTDPMLLTLRGIIARAKAATQDDPNKSVAFQARFTAATRKQLKQLASILQMNQQKVVVAAIHELHKKFNP